MALSWSFRRKSIYLSVGSLLALVFIWAMYTAFLTAPPTCFDGKQNNDEQGIDCSGSCSLLCPDSARPPVVSWSRAFETGSNTYTAAAYVKNTNVSLNAGARGVRYSFQLFDVDNQLVVERSGVIDIPPSERIPIVETNIDVGNRTVSRALFSFGNVPVWNKIPIGSLPQLRVSDQQLSSDGSRLSATVTNNSTIDAPRFVVLAVLFDQQGTAQAASKSSIPFLAHKSSQSVVFTWPSGVPNIVRAEVTILPSW